MSRAFVKETDNAAPLPERMVPEGSNPVTAAGLAQIDAHVARLEAALKASPDVLARETLERDLRYWALRKANAEVQPPPHGEAVTFGSHVIFTRNGRKQSYRIVGEDEADPAQGLLNVRSPLAAALIGATQGDAIEFQSGEIEILAVEN